MKDGFLWYDNRKNIDLNVRIGAAVDFFKSKYGYVPHKCFVNPAILVKPIKIGEQVEVIPNERVLSNHFWIEFITD